MIEIVMPRLSDSMEEGTILRWLVEDGEWVSRGDELIEIETDKAAMVHNSDADGLLEIIAPEGSTHAVGETIGQLLPGVPPESGDAALANPEESSQVSESPEPSPSGVPAPATAAARIHASPVARRTAQELGVDLSTVSGSGPQGRIVRGDVEQAASGEAQTTSPAPPQATDDAHTDETQAAALADGLAGSRTADAGDAEAAPADQGMEGPEAPEATQTDSGETDTEMADPGADVKPQTAKGAVTRIEPTKAQQVITRRMSESRATVPDFTLEADVDATRLVDLRRQLKEISAGKAAPTVNDLVVRACALALKAAPAMNGAWRDGGFEQYSSVNVGVAVSTDGGLVVPVISGADGKDIHEIASEARELARRARDGSITPPELSGGTFSVSNLGMFGIDRFTAIINPPQAAILAVGSIREAAVANDGELAIGKVMSLTLSVDHRAVYGAEAARFLADVAERLAAPASLL